MTHEQALDWFDKADNMQRAGVKIRMVKALQERSAEMASATDAQRKFAISAAMVKAVMSEIGGEPLPA